MRRWRIAAGTVAATLLLALAPTSASAAELVTNGGFESGSLSPWTCSGATGSVVSTPVHGGTKALQGAASSSDNAQCTQTVSGLVSGTSYTLSGWFRGNYTYLGITGGASTWTPGGSSYTQLSLTFTASSSSVQVYTHGWYGQGTYYADDISLSGQGGSTVPGTPGTPTVGTITNSSIALSWSASSGTVTGYRVYEGSTVVATITGTSATISGLATCSSHTYNVTAYNSVGESPHSGNATATTTGCAAVPGTPGTPTVGTITNTSIALSWGASSGTVTGYRVYEGSTVVATITGTSTTISGLATCSSHTYNVTAYNSTGESAHSGNATASTTGCAAVPGTPGTPAVGTVTNTSIALSWGASSGTVTGYRVYEGSTVVATITGTSATISGLATCSSHTYNVTAYNSVGESAHSGNATATTTGCQTGTLPKHLLTGYWQNFTNGATPLRLSSVPTTYDIIAVAFAEANPNQAGAVTFSVDSGLSTALGGYTNAQLTADIATLHSRNQKVILSVGGEKGSVAVSSSAAATNFANSVRSLMTTFGFDGVDIDLENGLNPTYMEQALRSLRSQSGSSLIITMAPQTIDMQSTGGSYFQLALNIKDILTIVHTQFYNSGGMLGCDQMFAYGQGTINFLTALACIQLQSQLRPDQIALGLPATTSAAGGGYVSPGVVNNALDCLAARTNCGSFVPPTSWPTIRGAMTWSINWDASNGYNFANTVHNHLVAMP